MTTPGRTLICAASDLDYLVALEAFDRAAQDAPGLSMKPSKGDSLTYVDAEGHRIVELRNGSTFLAAVLCDGECRLIMDPGYIPVMEAP